MSPCLSLLAAKAPVAVCSWTPSYRQRPPCTISMCNIQHKQHAVGVLLTPALQCHHQLETAPKNLSTGLCKIEYLCPVHATPGKNGLTFQFFSIRLKKYYNLN